MLQACGGCGRSSDNSRGVEFLLGGCVGGGGGESGWLCCGLRFVVEHGS
jgi:hypothetical protein